MSVWNSENIKDVAESVGVASLQDEVLQALSSDVEYRLSQILEEALRFMRHARRSVLTTQDVAQALRVLEIEPLYGYESTRPLRFGEASLGPGQPLFYVEDEEVDLEKLINTPLPKIPREITFTAHWLAVEGVQPSIPQNPTAADARAQELLPKGPGVHPSLGAVAGGDNTTVKPLVKHILSKELQLYFEKVCGAILDEQNPDHQQAALASLRTDPGLHQLVPYFVQFVSEKVTHNLSQLSVLRQMLDLTLAILENTSLFVDPYIASLVPPVLTCAISPRLGAAAKPLEHFPLRATAASLLGRIAQKFSKSSQTLKPRLARTCLKHFLDPKRPLAVQYGAILGLKAIAGREGVRSLILPNLQDYSKLLQESLEAGPPGDKDAEFVIGAIIGSLQALDDQEMPLVNGFANGSVVEYQDRLRDKVGPLIADRVVKEGNPRLVQAILSA